MRNGHEGGRLQVAVLRDVSVDQVGSEAFNRVVDFVPVHVSGKSAHCEVGPVRILNAARVAVVLNYGQTVFQCFSI